MTPNVATTDTGRARLGMSVARTFRRNRKITSTTSPNATSRVICTSWIDSRIGIDRSDWTASLTDGGSWAWSVGSSSLDGRRHLDGVRPRLPLNAPARSARVIVAGLAVRAALGEPRRRPCRSRRRRSRSASSSSRTGLAVAVGDDHRAVLPRLRRAGRSPGC